MNKVAELQYGTLPQLKNRLEEMENKIHEREDTLVRERVTEDEISRIVSRWTGIPVAKLTESERNKTLNLDKELHKRVIGQDEGVPLSLIHILMAPAVTKTFLELKDAQPEKWICFRMKRATSMINIKNIMYKNIPSQ